VLFELKPTVVVKRRDVVIIVDTPIGHIRYLLRHWIAVVKGREQNSQKQIKKSLVRLVQGKLSVSLSIVGAAKEVPAFFIEEDWITIIIGPWIVKELDEPTTNIAKPIADPCEIIE
jgi:hypothetical protein